MVMAPPSENTNGVHRIEQAAEKPAMAYVYSVYYRMCDRITQLCVGAPRARCAVRRYSEPQRHWAFL